MTERDTERSTDVVGWGGPLLPPAPPPPPPAGPPYRAIRSRALIVAVTAVVVALLLAGSVTALLRSGDGSATRAGGGTATPSATDPGLEPRTAVDAYYAALIARDPTAAFALLCRVQQQSGLAPYRALVERNQRTGSGVAQWQSMPDVKVRGDEADVSGTIVLENQLGTPIRVTLLLEAAGWRVCGSNLGGILPGPGGEDPGPGTST